MFYYLFVTYHSLWYLTLFKQLEFSNYDIFLIDNGLSKLLSTMLCWKCLTQKKLNIIVEIVDAKFEIIYDINKYEK